MLGPPCPHVPNIPAPLSPKCQTQVWGVSKCPMFKWSRNPCPSEPKKLQVIPMFKWSKSQCPSDPGPGKYTINLPDIVKFTICPPFPHPPPLFPGHSQAPEQQEAPLAKLAKLPIAGRQKSQLWGEVQGGRSSWGNNRSWRLIIVLLADSWGLSVHLQLINC